MNEHLVVAHKGLRACQAIDGGWGVTPDSASSIVNTAEALYVIRQSADAIGARELAALRYIADALPLHARAREDGGRGANTRFVGFGLQALGMWPETTFSTEPLLAALDWSLTWLETSSARRGWPERRGDPDTSIHQTAVVTLSLANLLPDARRLSPFVPSGQERVERISALALRGYGALAWHRRSIGFWPPKTFSDGQGSPSKTALAVLALDAAASSGIDTSGVPFDGALDGPRIGVRVDEAVADGAAWLVAHHARWETFVEHDPEVPGTDWIHPAYAIATAAACCGGVDPESFELRKAWALMRSLWDPDIGLWREPGGRATIRSGFHVVRAEFYAKRSRIRREIVPTRQNAVQALETIEIHHGALLIRGLTGDHRIAISERLLALVNECLKAGASGVTTGDLATALDLSPSSVSQYVQRTNAAVTKRTQRLVGEIIYFDQPARKYRIVTARRDDV